ncbi:MAG: hypothetical protein KDC24_05850 [Saprospiraceae bacterium]|nr:hypothetical protein [Saprospiraceae bacterium]
MRHLVAWLLLSLLSFYWIGGQLLHHFTVSYEVELERKMDNTEARLSHQLHTLTGIDRSVLIIQDEELDLSEIGYSGTFLFNEVVNGKPVYYIVETSQPTAVVEVNQNLHTPNKDLEHTMVLEHMFPKYFNAFEKIEIATFSEPAVVNNFYYTGIFKGVESSIPTPPPRFA